MQTIVGAYAEYCPRHSVASDTGHSSTIFRLVVLSQKKKKVLRQLCKPVLLTVKMGLTKFSVIATAIVLCCVGTAGARRVLRQVRHP